MDTFAHCLTLIYNQWLQRDPQHKYFLDRLHHKTLCITITDMGYRLVFSPQPSSLNITLITDTEIDADIAIVATLGQLTKLLLDDHPQRYIQGGELHFDGSIHYLQAYFDLFKNTRPDLSFAISQQIGVTPARILEQPFEALCRYLKQSHFETKADLKEYLSHEQQWCLTYTEFDQHIANIRTLKQLADRVDAKLKQLGA